MKTLDIGEILISQNDPIDVWFVLGSCIAVIFYVENKVSIACHSQLSKQSADHDKCFHQCSNPCFKELEETNKNKYVKCTLEYMINYLKRMNIDIADVKTTIIGGASIMEKVSDVESVGETNIRVAKEILENEGIKIGRELIGGKYGYTIWYNTGTDKLFVKIQNENSEKFELIYKT